MTTPARKTAPNVSLAAAFGCTACAFFIAYSVYVFKLQALIEFRTTQNAGYFHLQAIPAIGYPTLCFLMGWFAIRTRWYVLATLVTLLVGFFLVPWLAWTRPPDHWQAVEAINGIELLTYALGIFLNALFIAIWHFRTRNEPWRHQEPVVADESDVAAPANPAAC